MDVAETLLKLIAPISPHIADELWQTALGNDDSIHLSSWPEFDPEMAKADTVEIAVQVNGKVKTRIDVAVDASKEDMIAAGREAVSKSIDGKTVVKEVAVPGRLVNIVVK